MAPVRFVCLDWGGTLMSEDGPAGRSMADWDQVQVVAGARELLAALAPDYTLCIATNASVSHRADIERALARAELMEFISHVFCFRDLGARKDSAAFWSAVTDTLGCAPEEVAMLGDSLEQDVTGPASHGIRSFWFDPRALPAPRGVTAIHRLEEFTGLLVDLR